MSRDLQQGRWSQHARGADVLTGIAWAYPAVRVYRRLPRRVRCFRAPAVGLVWPELVQLVCLHHGPGGGAANGPFPPGELLLLPHDADAEHLVSWRLAVVQGWADEVCETGVALTRQQGARIMAADAPRNLDRLAAWHHSPQLVRFKVQQARVMHRRLLDVRQESVGLAGHEIHLLVLISQRDVALHGGHRVCRRVQIVASQQIRRLRVGRIQALLAGIPRERLEPL